MQWAHPTSENVCVIPTSVGIYIQARYLRYLLWSPVCTGMADPSGRTMKCLRFRDAPDAIAVNNRLDAMLGQMGN